MKNAIKQLETAKQEVFNAKVKLIDQGVSFFSLTMQDLDEAEQQIKEALTLLKRNEVAIENLK